MHVLVDFNQISVDLIQILVYFIQISVDLIQISVEFMQILFEFNQISVDFMQISVDLNQISVDYYHAVLDSETREKKQNLWINNKIRVIACTNAFGMGIDKPDVRTVLHFQPPDCIEAYFQEAGRAGRDGKKSWAGLLYDDNDIQELEYQLSSAFPERAEIKQVYQALVNYFQLATGSGKDDFMEFDIIDFCNRYNLNTFKANRCIDLLVKNAYVYLTDSAYLPSRLMFKVNKEQLHQFLVNNPKLEPILKIILRSYSGLFDEFVNIREKDLAFRTKLPLERMIKALNYLHSTDIISYIPQSSLPKINFCTGVIKADELFIDKETFEKRKEAIQKRGNAFIKLLKDDSQCRSRYMLNYFGEQTTHDCGQCDVCLKNNKASISFTELTAQEIKLMEWLKTGPVDYNWLQLQFPKASTARELVRHLSEQGKVIQNGDWVKLV